jgi:hypothetical protein
MSDYARPLVHFQIHARDRKRLQAFYAALFNWDIQEREGLPIANIGYGIGGPPEGVAGSILQAEKSRVAIYVQVADLAASIAKAEQLGGKKVLERLDVPNGPTIGQIEDPEGNLVGLVQQ